MEELVLEEVNKSDNHKNYYLKSFNREKIMRGSTVFDDLILTDIGFWLKLIGYNIIAIIL